MLGHVLHTVKLIASCAAAAIALVAYIPYLIDMFKGKNKPHLYTWVSMFLVTAVIGYIQFVGGAGMGAIPTFLGAGVDGVILFYCFRFGTKDIVRMDRFCLAASVAGITLYVALRRAPFAALAVMAVAEVISFVPTFRKTRNDPYSESLPSYYFLIVKFSLIIIAVQRYNWLTVSYPAMWGLVCILFVTMTYQWRTKPVASRAPAILEKTPLA